MRNGGPVGGSVDAHQSGHTRRNEVEATARSVGTGLAEPRNRAVDEPGIERGEGFEANSETVGGARLEALDHDVRDRGHLLERREALGRLQIERHRALVPVPQHERRALAAHERRRAAHVVPALGVFDLDNVGAVVGEDHRAVRAGEVDGEVQHPEVLQGHGHGSAPFFDCAAPSVSRGRTRVLDADTIVRVAAFQSALLMRDTCVAMCDQHSCRGWDPVSGRADPEDAAVLMALQSPGSLGADRDGWRRGRVEHHDSQPG